MFFQLDHFLGIIMKTHTKLVLNGSHDPTGIPSRAHVLLVLVSALGASPQDGNTCLQTPGVFLPIVPHWESAAAHTLEPRAGNATHEMRTCHFGDPRSFFLLLLLFVEAGSASWLNRGALRKHKVRASPPNLKKELLGVGVDWDPASDKDMPNNTHKMYFLLNIIK